MKRNLILAVCLTGSMVAATAQTKGGELSADMLKDIVKEHKQVPVNKALVSGCECH